MANTDSTRSGSGAFSSLGQGKSNVHYGTMPEQIVKQLQTQGNSGEFVVISRTRQSDEPEIWSSGDSTQTEQLLRSVAQYVTEPTP